MLAPPAPVFKNMGMKLFTTDMDTVHISLSPRLFAQPEQQGFPYRTAPQSSSLLKLFEMMQLPTDPRNIVWASKIGVHEVNSCSRPKLSEESISAIFRKIQRAPCEKIAHFEKNCQNLGRFFNFEAFLTSLQPISWKIKAIFGNLKQFYIENWYYLLYFLTIINFWRPFLVTVFSLRRAIAKKPLIFMISAINRSKTPQSWKIGISDAVNHLV